MNLLEILGALFLVFLAFVFVLGVYVWWRRRQLLGRFRALQEGANDALSELMRALGSAAERAGAGGDGAGHGATAVSSDGHIGVTPMAIHLQSRTPAWRDREQVEAFSDELEQLGFELRGAWTIDEMPGVGLVGFAHPGEGVMAVVYEHPAAGVWADLVLRYADDTSLTVTNAPQGGLLDQPPGHEKRYATGDSLRDLWSVTQTHRRSAPTVTWSGSEFARGFEQAYAEEMEWRRSRGGATLEEIQRIAADMGGVNDPDVITLAKAFLDPHGEMADACLDEWAEQEGLSDDERERHGAVLERMSARDVDTVFAGMIGDWEPPDELDEFIDEMVNTPPDVGAYGAIREIARRMPPGRRLEHVATIDSPARAEIWRFA